MQVLRSMLAIILGYAVFSVSAKLFFQLTSVDPQRPASFFGMIFGVLFGAAVAFAAGFVTGWIAGQKPLVHATSISILLVFGTVISTILGAGSKWTMFSTLVVSIPMTFVGALAYSRRLPAETPQAKKPEDPFQNVDELLKD